MNYKKVIFIFCLFVVLMPLVAEASFCTGASNTLVKLYKERDDVAILNIPKEMEGYTVTSSEKFGVVWYHRKFFVVHRYKGNKNLEPYVVLSVYAAPSMNFDFEEGERYLSFSYGNDEGNKASLFSGSICSTRVKLLSFDWITYFINDTYLSFLFVAYVSKYGSFILKAILLIVLSVFFSKFIHLIRKNKK